MDVDFLPEHLVIVGGSYIGLEFGQMHRRFGSEITIVEMGPRLIGREDEDISEAVRQILEAEGIQIRLNAKCISLAKHDSRIAVGIRCDEGPPEVLGTHVLLAVGRTPNTHDLGLDRAGVATDERGYIIVDDTGGDEVVHVLLDAMYAKAPYTVVQRAMHIHPTVPEFLPTVLSKLEPFA